MEVRAIAMQDVQRQQQLHGQAVGATEDTSLLPAQSQEQVIQMNPLGGLFGVILVSVLLTTLFNNPALSTSLQPNIVGSIAELIAVFMIVPLAVGCSVHFNLLKRSGNITEDLVLLFVSSAGILFSQCYDMTLDEVGPMDVCNFIETLTQVVFVVVVLAFNPKVTLWGREFLWTRLRLKTAYAFVPGFFIVLNAGWVIYNLLGPEAQDIMSNDSGTARLAIVLQSAAVMLRLILVIIWSSLSLSGTESVNLGADIVMTVPKSGLQGFVGVAVRLPGVSWLMAILGFFTALALGIASLVAEAHNRNADSAVEQHYVVPPFRAVQLANATVASVLLFLLRWTMEKLPHARLDRSQSQLVKSGSGGPQDNTQHVQQDAVGRTNQTTADAPVTGIIAVLQQAFMIAITLGSLHMMFQTERMAFGIVFNIVLLLQCVQQADIAFQLMRFEFKVSSVMLRCFAPAFVCVFNFFWFLSNIWWGSQEVQDLVASAGARFASAILIGVVLFRFHAFVCFFFICWKTRNGDDVQHQTSS